MSCYEKATSCTREMRGARALYDYILKRSPNLAGNGIYACRPPRPQVMGWSVHAEGRAMDINAALPSGAPNPAPIPPGSPADTIIRMWRQLIVQNHVALGVQRVLYKSDEWRCDTGWRGVSVSLGKLHQNHIHIELNRSSSRTLTSAQIEAAFRPGAQDMTPTQEAKLDKVLKTLDDYFGIGPQGAKDIRAKIDANYIGLYGDDHDDLVAGRVLQLEASMDAVLAHLGIPKPQV